MSIEENIAVLEKFNQILGQFWENGDVTLFDKVVAQDSVIHQPGMPNNLEGLKQVLPAFRSAFPDFRVLEFEAFSEGDKIADQIVWTATHTGELMGISATGKTITVKEMHISRVKNGRIVERWGLWDQLGMMQQLGAVPQ
ncbi:MAG: ester cyclase [Trueperaceae bacterium]|nr:ester cyclase [Trueperaceae bacterium]